MNSIVEIVRAGETCHGSMYHSRLRLRPIPRCGIPGKWTWRECGIVGCPICATLRRRQEDQGVVDEQVVGEAGPGNRRRMADSGVMSLFRNPPIGYVSSWPKTISCASRAAHRAEASECREAEAIRKRCCVLRSVTTGPALMRTEPAIFVRQHRAARTDRRSGLGPEASQAQCTHLPFARHNRKIATSGRSHALGSS